MIEMERRTNVAAVNGEAAMNEEAIAVAVAQLLLLGAMTRAAAVAPARREEVATQKGLLVVVDEVKGENGPIGGAIAVRHPLLLFNLLNQQQQHQVQVLVTTMSYKEEKKSIDTSCLALTKPTVPAAAVILIT